MTLTAEDFPAFYRAVHRHDPFPWQTELTGRILADGTWPELVDVPTGLGKTSMLDIAVFVAAATSGQGGAGRVGRRRCFFVVDRRLVVDEATTHAEKLARSINDPAGSLGDSSDEAAGKALRGVAAGLRAYCPDDSRELLSVTAMHGGTTWASNWLDRPDRPAIVLGTVDQLGSRLFFRGYGIRPYRRPIDAALVGTDSLVLVDEAHLATALTTTIAAAQDRDRSPLPVPPMGVVRLTATTGSLPARVYRLDPAAHAGSTVAGQRLNAPKVLLPLASSAKDVVKDLSTVAARVAGGDGGPRAVLVVCNTVDRARAVHTVIRKAVTAKDGSTSMDVDLLIGRSRQVDRRALQERVLQRFGIGREPLERSAVLVATQTVEVGLNLDADALVTESASWDALVQRLGRLNRLGERPGTGSGAAAPAVVVHDGQNEGPVYKQSRDAAWEFLAGRIAPLGSAADAATVGLAVAEGRAAAGTGLAVSPLQCRELAVQVPAEAFLDSGQPPLLLEPILDAWTRTYPAPSNDVPLDPYLHGFDSGSASVAVAWRTGLQHEGPAGTEWVASETADSLLQAVPVRAQETMELPLHTVRAWLQGDAVPPVSDVDSAADIEVRRGAAGPPFQVLVQREAAGGASWTWLRDPAALRPGDQLVVPADAGGVDEYGWNPASTRPVRDVAELAALAARRPILRLDRGLGARLGVPEDVEQALRECFDAIEEDEDETPQARSQRVVRMLTEAFRRPKADEHWSAWLSTTPTLINCLEGLGHPAVWVVRGGWLPDPQKSGARGAVEREDDHPWGTSLGERPVTLAQHHRRVGERAEEIALALGLSGELDDVAPGKVVDVVREAAALHDLGKREGRFQIMLHRGDPVEAALAEEPLAKSGLDPADTAAWRSARKASGLPRGARHEAWSAALVRQLLAEDPDWFVGDAELLVHLIASHHGRARPLLPLVVDSDPRAVEVAVGETKVSVDSARTVDPDHAETFARLNRRYGRWGLALLESIVRCADMTVSAEGS